MWSTYGSALNVVTTLMSTGTTITHTTQTQAPTNKEQFTVEWQRESFPQDCQNTETMQSPTNRKNLVVNILHNLDIPFIIYRVLLLNKSEAKTHLYWKLERPGLSKNLTVTEMAKTKNLEVIYKFSLCWLFYKKYSLDQMNAWNLHIGCHNSFWLSILSSTFMLWTWILIIRNI